MGVFSPGPPNLSVRRSPDPANVFSWWTGSPLPESTDFSVYVICAPGVPFDTENSRAVYSTIHGHVRLANIAMPVRRNTSTGAFCFVIDADCQISAVSYFWDVAREYADVLRVVRFKM